MGKFLNGYLESSGARLPTADHRGRPADIRAARVVATGTVAGWGYPEFNYTLNENGVLHRYGHQPSDYLTDVIARRGRPVHRPGRAGRQAVLPRARDVRPALPVHARAPRSPTAFRGCERPAPPSFDVLPTHAAAMAGRPPSPDRAGRSGRSTRRSAGARSPSKPSTDDRHDRADAARATASPRNTYLFFSSDNGLHTGRVPADARQADRVRHRYPRSARGDRPRRSAPARRPARWPRTSIWPRRSRRSPARRMRERRSQPLPLLHGHHAADWRNAILVEHHGGRHVRPRPGLPATASGNPTTYEAMRTHQFLYVEYADGEREFYDLATDPFELHNLAGRLTPRRAGPAARRARQTRRCHGGDECWAAMHVHPPLVGISNTLSRPL